MAMRASATLPLSSSMISNPAWPSMRVTGATRIVLAMFGEAMRFS